MIKTVFFDLDGTLLNRDASVVKFTNNQYQRLTALQHISQEEYVARFIQLDERGYVWKDIVYQKLVEEFNITDMKWNELLQDYVNHFRDDCVPFPYLHDMLRTLKNMQIQLGIITNGPGQFQTENIKALEIEKDFDLILISEYEGIKKPDPRIFYRALEQTNSQAKHSLFVGDHPENDMQAAHHKGMKTIWKRDEYSGNVCADFMIDELNEIPSIIAALNTT